MGKDFWYVALGILAVLFVVSSTSAEVVFVKHVVAQSFNSWSAMAEDVDGDGDIDIVASDRLHSRIAWWENDGRQEFRKHIVIRGFEGATSVQIKDIDGDGDLDILGTAQFDEEVAWFEQRQGRPKPRSVAARRR